MKIIFLFCGCFEATSNFHTHGRTFSFSFGIVYAPFLENEKFPLPAYRDKEIAILFVPSGVLCSSPKKKENMGYTVGQKIIPILVVEFFL